MTDQHPMEQYHSLMRRCMVDGEPIDNARTGIVCHTLIGEQLKFDLADGFPAITTKKLAWNAMVGELLGILHGATSAAEFRALGCRVWDGNANQTPAWLANPHRKGVDDCGRAYGAQWCDFTDLRVVHSEIARDDAVAAGYQFLGVVEPPEGGRRYLVRRGIHQVENALIQIMTNPTNRQNVITGWRPDEHDRTCLPVCHMTYTWAVNTRTKALDLVMHQRSWDLFLAFNIPMCALFLSIMARLAGLKPGVVTMQVANVHVYSHHLPQVRTQLSREHYQQPLLGMSSRIKPLASPAEVAGIFKTLRPEDFWLEGYQHHPALPASMAV